MSLLVKLLNEKIAALTVERDAARDALRRQSAPPAQSPAPDEPAINPPPQQLPDPHSGSCSGCSPTATGSGEIQP